MKQIKGWKSIAIISAVLLITVIVGDFLAHAYSTAINSALGLSTSVIVPLEQSDHDTNYYKSSFGELTAENQANLVQAALAQTVIEMEEGAALLYNANNALPLTNEVNITVFGHASVDPAYQANAAGTKVTNTSLNVVTFLDALLSEGFQVNPTLITALEKGSAHRGNTNSYGVTVPDGSAAGTEENKAFYQNLQSSWATEYNEAAIVMFARSGAESVDLKMQDVDDDGVTPISSLALHQNEKDLLELVRKDFKTVIVILNSPNQMEVGEILPYCDALLYIGFPGHQGFTGVAEILRGLVNPSGRLVDTYAVNSLSAPACVNSGTNTPQFSNSTAIDEAIGADEKATYISFQAEGIYVGYKYYETRYADVVMGKGNANSAVGASNGATNWDYSNEVSFTFGYGLSYTTFSQKIDSVRVGADSITLQATVTNNGSVQGKSVVQVYAQTPYGEYEIKNKVEKSAVSLVGFAKTDLLKAGESQQLTITIDKYLLAGYDYVNAKGYILSGGDYYLGIGNDAHDALNNILAARGYTTADVMTSNGDASKVFLFKQNFDAKKYKLSTNKVKVTNLFDDCNLNYWIGDSAVYLSRNDWSGTYPTKQTTVQATDEMIKILGGDWYTKPTDASGYQSVAALFGSNAGLTLAMMKDVPISDRATWRQFVLQMAIEDLPNATAESFTCPAVGELSPSFLVGDGCDSVGRVYPFKIMVDGEETKVPTIRYCSKPILTGTFNVELYASRGTLMGEEGVWCGLMQVFCVGANMHRTPFGGRNFEYMTEDANLAYLASIPEVRAMEKTGSHAAPKHFTGNDQEFQRTGLVTFFNEQAFREGNLRAFEGSLKVSRAGGLMQSFSRVGLRWASSCYALNTTLLRNEWGWLGNAVTDAAPVSAKYVEGEGFKNHSCEVISSGSTQWCLDGKAGHGKIVLDIAQATDDGALVENMIDAAISWEYSLANSVIINGMERSAKIVQITPWYLIVLDCSIGVLSAILLLSIVVVVVKKKSIKENENSHK